MKIIQYFKSLISTSSNYRYAPVSPFDDVDIKVEKPKKAKKPKVEDVTEIKFRVATNEYLPMINGKYLYRWTHMTGEYELQTGISYCLKFDSEQEAIDTIKDYYRCKDIKPIIHIIDILDKCVAQVIHYTLSNKFYPMIDSKYIYKELQGTYKLRDEYTFCESRNDLESAVKVISDYAIQQGYNDVTYKIKLL